MGGTWTPQWAKIVSIELLGSILVTAFLVGGSWVALSKDVRATDDRAVENGKKIASMEESLQQIEVKVEKSLTRQESILQQQEKQGRQLDEIQRLLLRNLNE